jgi:L-fuconolactonase
MKIDAHQHFWIYNPREYGWMGPGMETLKRDYLPPDLARLLTAAGIDGTVAVQARQCLEESHWLLELADHYPFIKGVVGWVDLLSMQVDEQLSKLARHRKFRGVRHVVHDEPDDGFMLREDFVRGISRLANYGLTYDLLLFPRHLPVACELVKRFPEQPFVVDHLAKPPVKAHELSPWEADLRCLAAFPNVYCKLSGMVTEADWQHWKPADFTPYLDVVLECFGTKRLMVGSDWPVCTLAGNYSQVMQISSDYLRKLSKDEQVAVWGDNAKRLYGIAE